MDFKEPVKIYTAASNVEAHMIVIMLDANGVPAFAEEDRSGVSLWAFGMISQFHQPNVWVDKPMAERAAELISRFEERKREREERDSSRGDIQVECEECGWITTFPASLNGTTQECSKCRAFVDVGEWDWDEHFGDPGDVV